MPGPLEKLKDIDKEKLESGSPRFLKPMLATLTHDRFSDENWIFERKLDGERCLAVCRKGEDNYEEACRKGWEGLIAKQMQSAYVCSRSKKWLKFKCVLRQEFVIGGFTDPEGSRVGLGALLIGYYKKRRLIFAGKVGTGFDDKTLKSLRRKLDRIERKTSPFEAEAVSAGDGIHWVTPGLVCEIGFTQWTRCDKLRHPRFLGLRRDKDPEKVIREDR